MQDPLTGVQPPRDDHLCANSCTQSLDHPPWECPILFTCHACRSPLGRDSYQSSLSQGLFDCGAPYRLVHTPMLGPSVTLTSPLLSAGLWLANHLFWLIFIVWVTEVRGLHAPRLDAAPSSATLTSELPETLAHPPSLPVDPAFGATP